MSKHWRGIKNPVTLRLPNGTEWEVSWTKLEDGDVLFCNGWKQFSEYLSLNVSQFVVFQYEGNSCFNLIVFDKTALEIKYPLRETDDEGEEEADQSSEDDGSPILRGNKRRKSPSPFYQNCDKKMKRHQKEQKECYRSHTETKHEKKSVPAHAGF